MGAQNNFSYNISGYNKSADTDNSRSLFINRWFKAIMGVIIAPSVTHTIARRFRVQSGGFALGNRVFVMPARHFISRISSAVKLQNRIYLQNTFADRIKACINASKQIFIKHNFTAGLFAAIYSGRIIRFTRTKTAKFNGSIRAGKIIKISRHNFAYIGSHAQLTMMQYLLMEIGTTIPPGGEIRINSENFTAMQGFGNILALHRGDWIFVGPDTHTISITASGGDASGQLVYTERHL